LFLSLYEQTKENRYIEEAEHLVSEVKRVLGRSKGYRIGEEPDRDGQYFHYLTKWIFALHQLSIHHPDLSRRQFHHQEAIKIIKEIHPHFLIRDVGILWKMKEDLSGPFPGYGLGGLDHYDAYVVYRLVDGGSGILAREISDVFSLVQNSFRNFSCSQDLGLGEALWMTSWFPEEEWAQVVRERSIKTLEKMWREVDQTKGYFIRDLKYERTSKLAFGSYGVCIGLQSIFLWPDRVAKCLNYFEEYRSGDKYDREAITWTMACCARLPISMLKTQTPAAAEH